MNITETSAVLAKIKLGDNRAVDSQIINEWHQTIGHNSYGDALNAVIEHRRDSTEYLQPAHINAICKRARAARAEKAHHEALVPPNRADFPTMPQDILDALSAGWNDPVAYADAEQRWNDHLVAHGFTPQFDTFKGYPAPGYGR